jgi:hypothetical protein
MTTGFDNLKKTIDEAVAQSEIVKDRIDGIKKMLTSTHMSLVMCAHTSVLAYDDFMVFNYPVPRKNAGPLSFLDLSAEIMFCEKKARHDKITFTAFFVEAMVTLNNGFYDIEKLDELRLKVIDVVQLSINKNQDSVNELKKLDEKITLFKKNIK